MDAGHQAFSTTVTTDRSGDHSQADEEHYLTTFFCRALYDYQTKDPSSLSFHKDDIIEVLTQLESGWWDGLLGDERGWFPSNYVAVISDEEAEVAFSSAESSVQQSLDMNEDDRGQHHAADHSASDSDWLSADAEQARGSVEPRNDALEISSQSSDFWLPRVTQDGQIYYVNTQTGQHSRDLPTEVDEDTSDSDLAGLTSSQSSSRAGTSSGLGFMVPPESPFTAGFGVPKRTGTPEPWVRRLADDGMSYFYWNKITDEIQWNPPAVEAYPSREKTQWQTRPRADSSAASSDVYSSQDDALGHDGLNSADSSIASSKRRSRIVMDVPSARKDDLESTSRSRERSPSTVDSHRINGRHDTWSLQEAAIEEEADGRQLPGGLTVAEKLAQSLQQTLLPPSPPSLSELSDIARSAIKAAISNSQILSAFPRRPEQDKALDSGIDSVIVAVRNLLYVSALPTGHIPNGLVPRDGRERRDTSASQTPLKPAQRKVIATLSKLVLSARAVQYDSGHIAQETGNRIESDADELERAIAAFVLEVQRRQDEIGETSRRLYGCLITSNIGLGLIGGGAAGNWKGFGWTPLGNVEEMPKKVLETELYNEFKFYALRAQAKFVSLNTVLRKLNTDESVHEVLISSQDLITEVHTVLLYLADVNIARHVDVDGFHPEAANMQYEDLYMQTVHKARLLVRTLEAIVQSLYDDTAALLLVTQRLRFSGHHQLWQHQEARRDTLDAQTVSINSNLQFLLQTTDALLSIGHDQADVAQGEYNGSIEWRMSRLSIIDSSNISVQNPTVLDSDDIVDMEVAFSNPIKKSVTAVQGSNTRLPLYEVSPEASFSSAVRMDNSSTSFVGSSDSSWMDDSNVSLNTLIPPSSPTSIDGQSAVVASTNQDPSAFESSVVAVKSPSKASKIKQIFGDDAPEHLINTLIADAKPWYLRPNYSPTDIIIDPDGTVKAGTVAALVERLTAHEHGDPTFIKTFLMTFKSFTTVDELFELLKRRFFIAPPDGLKDVELEEWKKLKQHIIQMRVLNTMKSMVQDEDILDKEDVYIFERMKKFLLHKNVIGLPAAKQLLVAIERAQRGGDKKKITANYNLPNPPPSITPKSNKKIKLLDIDPLELARQLTMMESQLYLKIKPVECLQRAREQKTDYSDNIARVIQTSNRIACWVADSVLSHEDSKKRANVLKQFISVADRCRGMNNYSTMSAIVAGLNSPPIRRLKRSWEQVNTRFMSQHGACEMTIDSNKNFTNYRSTLARVTPPCVPFIGTFLTTLTFIQDGSKDTLPGNLVNFRKRQKTSEVIQDIQRWQTLPHNFHPALSIIAYLEESLSKFTDVDIGDEFWNLSLEREPREREDEKMARLLQESGFL